MSRRRFMLAAATLAVLASCADQPTAPDTYNPSFNVVEAATQRHIVAFKARSVPGDFARAVAALGGTVEASLDKVGGVIVSGLSAEAVAKLTGRRDVLGIAAEDLIPFRARSSQPFELAQPDVQSVSAPNTAILYSLQWNMRAIGAQHAWTAGKVGSSNVKVAILDTGLDPQSLDAVGLIDMANSKSFVADDDKWVTTLFPGRPLISDLHGHGTNVASQVSSTAFATAGVTSKTKLLGVKVCSHALEACPVGSVLAGFLYAVENGADVINMSLGGGFLKNHGGGSLVALINRVFQVAEQNGVTVVVAAGNDEIDMDHITNVHMTYCDQTHVICVSATGPTNEAPLDNVDQFAFYSNFGRARVDVAAPGGNAKFNAAGDTLLSAAFVYSLCSRSSADLVKDEKGKLKELVAGACSRRLLVAGQIGTSQASPHVAGLAALLVAEPTIGRNPALIREIITSTADDLGQAGTDPFYGRGRVNVKRALGL